MFSQIKSLKTIAYKKAHFPYLESLPTAHLLELPQESASIMPVLIRKFLFFFGKCYIKELLGVMLYGSFAKHIIMNYIKQLVSMLARSLPSLDLSIIFY